MEVRITTTPATDDCKPFCWECAHYVNGKHCWCATDAYGVGYSYVLGNPYDVPAARRIT